MLKTRKRPVPMYQSNTIGSVYTLRYGSNNRSDDYKVSPSLKEKSRSISFQTFFTNHFLQKLHCESSRLSVRPKSILPYC